jgi:hypothetical protein
MSEALRGGVPDAAQDVAHRPPGGGVAQVAGPTPAV